MRHGVSARQYGIIPWLVASAVLVGMVLLLFTAPARDWMLFRTVEEIDGQTRTEYREHRWGEHAGLRHGPFRRYQLGTRTVLGVGHYRNGVPTGLHTAFDPRGRVALQRLLADDGGQIELRLSPPWWDSGFPDAPVTSDPALHAPLGCVTFREGHIVVRQERVEDGKIVETRLSAPWWD